MKNVLVIFSLIIVVFTSCDTPRYAYNSTAHNVPVFTKKGDSKVAAYYSNNGVGSSSDDDGTEYDRNTSQGFDVQGAYAITNNVAVQADYYYRAESSNQSHGGNNVENANIKYKRNLASFGLGYFTPVDSRQRMLFQVYGGVGFGKTKISEKGTDFNLNNYTRFYNTNITKFYLEPSITFKSPKEFFAATVATRASVIKFGKGQTDYTYSERLDYNLDSLDRYAVLFFEPSFVGSFGFNKMPGFRIEVQAGLSVLYDKSFIDYRPFNFSLGLVFDIPKLINGSKKE